MNTVHHNKNFVTPISHLLQRADDRLEEERKIRETENLRDRVLRSRIIRQSDMISPVTSDMMKAHGISLLNVPDRIGQYCVMAGRKSLVGIGLRNEAGGLDFYHDELGSIVTLRGSSISVLRSISSASHDECMLFADFLDFLGYITVIHRYSELQKPLCDVVIIGHLSNVRAAIEHCDSYHTVNCFLPVSSSSETIINTLQHVYKGNVVDCSWFYKKKGQCSFLQFCEQSFGYIQ